MKRIACFSVIMLLMASFVHAEMDIAYEGPQEGDVLNSEDDLNIKITAVDSYLKHPYIYLGCPSSELKLIASEYYDYDDKKTTFEFSFPLFGQNPGPCKISYGAFLFDKQDKDYVLHVHDSLNFLLNPPEVEPEGSALVVRAIPKEFNPGGYLHLLYVIKPMLPEGEGFTGIIVRDNIPEVFSLVEPAPYLLLTSTSNIDHTYDDETGLLKLVISNPSEVGFENAWVSFIISDNIGPGEEFEFSGDWEILGETGPILGVSKTKASGFAMPGCPISDTELLGYIDQWSNMELDPDSVDNNDNLIMQIIEVWKSC